MATTYNNLYLDARKELRQAGVDVPLDALSVEECAAAIAQVIRPNTTVK